MGKLCLEFKDSIVKTTNGCGSSHWMLFIFRIPNFISKKLGIYCCCVCHDIQYQVRYDKEIADLDLRACIRHSALTGNPRWKKFKWYIGDKIYAVLNLKISNLAYGKNK